MTAPRIVVGLAVLALFLPLGGCGSEESGGESSAGADVALTASVASKAEAICRQLRRETQAIGRAIPRGIVPTNLAMTTDLLIEPSIPVLERTAERLQALEAQADDPEFELYVGMFDPIIVLAQQRLAAGKANDPTASKGFEAMLTDLGNEQRHVAVRAGLSDCAVDFRHVLVSSIAG